MANKIKLPLGIIALLQDTPSKGPYHPEETVLDHIQIMADRFSNSTQTVRAKLGLTWGDIKVVEQSILYHDLGKIDTVKWNEKTNGYSFYGHERYSLNRMKDLNAINPIPHYDRVRWIVSNHIRIHALTKGQMKNPFKIDKLKSNPDFKLLNWFEKLDDMILNYEDWANSLKEES